MNKRGWIHILEATIAVMIVAGVMVTVYSGQSADGELSISEYSYSLQNEILTSITMDSDLRLDILNVEVDNYTDEHFRVLDDAVSAEIPDSFGHLLRVCNLSDLDDVCNMPDPIFIATLEKNIFIEEEVIISELGDGTGVVYSPKKVRLFFWEGDVPEEDRYDECLEGSSLGCSLLGSEGIVNTTCADRGGFFEKTDVKVNCDFGDVCNATSVACEFGGCVNTCLDSVFCSVGDVWETICVDDGGCSSIGSTDMIDDCFGLGCSGGVCVGNRILTCSGRINLFNGCTFNFNVNADCNGYDEGESTLISCGPGLFEYNCWDIDSVNTGCSATPSCPEGYNMINDVSC